MQRYVVVQSNVRGRDLGGFAAEVRTAVRERVTFPSGYYVTYGGQFENQLRATRRLGIIVPLVLLLIAGLLYASFGSIRHALLVMLTVPFALVGGIAALWLRGLNLSLSASVGFIALFGVAVLNGIVLVAYINQLRAAGRGLRDAVAEGAKIRLRPVLMTALVASVGFIPHGDLDWCGRRSAATPGHGRHRGTHLLHSADPAGAPDCVCVAGRTASDLAARSPGMDKAHGRSRD